MIGETTGSGPQGRGWRWLPLMLALALLTSCGTSAPVDGGARRVGAANVSVRPAPAPPAESARPAPRTPEPAARTAARTKAPPPVDSDPEKLRGMDSIRLTGLLGQPVFLRRDAPAQLWRYRHKSCVLDLFLYPGGSAQGTIAVRHFEARSLNRSPTSPRACLGQLLRSRLAKGAG